MVIENIMRGFDVMGGGYDYHHYRTGGGAEIDLIPGGEFGLLPIEIRYGQTVTSKSLRGIRDFVSERQCPFGIVINNAERVTQYAET